ncbi:hypothetical protein [Burkholderia phage FLC9]|nr:hypothetical protein [Burkholderia phage FLC9]
MLSKLIESTPKIVATDVRLLLLHRYETDFGIFNHDLADDELDPLALIRMHPREDAYTGSFLAERLRQYNTRHVYEVTKMPFDRFLELPRHMVMDILEYADQELRTRTKIMQDEANDADARVRAMNQQNHPMRPPV